MAIIDKLSIETRFQLNKSTKSFKIIDYTDYASESISTADVIGSLKILNPLGLIIHETVLPSFDIDLSSTNYIDTIPLPLDSYQKVMEGDYTVEYTIRVSGAVQPGDYSESFSYNYCEDIITPNITIGVNLMSSVLTSTDNTKYPTTITSSTLSHTIFPPNGLDPIKYPERLVSTKVNEYTGITTKTWTSKISNILELTNPDGLIIETTITGDIEKDITHDATICNLKCNIESLVNKYSSALTTNPIDAERIFNDQVAPSLIYGFMFNSNVSCGDFDKAEYYYNEVLKSTGSEKGCQCDYSEEPSAIIPSVGGSGGSYVVDSCGDNDAISVSSNTVGEETTYTVCFKDDLFNKISALTETELTSSDSSVTITSSVTGYVKTYDLKASTSGSTLNSYSSLFHIQGQSGGTPTTSIFNEYFSGTRFVGATVSVIAVDYTSYLSNRNLFRFSFPNGAGNFFVPSINVNGTKDLSTFDFDWNVEIIGHVPVSNPAMLDFTIVDNAGRRLTGAEIGTGRITVSLQIIG